MAPPSAFDKARRRRNVRAVSDGVVVRVLHGQPQHAHNVVAVLQAFSKVSAQVHLLSKATTERSFENVCLQPHKFSKVSALVYLLSKATIESSFQNVSSVTNSQKSVPQYIYYV